MTISKTTPRVRKLFTVDILDYNIEGVKREIEVYSNSHNLIGPNKFSIYQVMFNAIEGNFNCMKILFAGPFNKLTGSISKLDAFSFASQEFVTKNLRDIELQLDVLEDREISLNKSLKKGILGFCKVKLGEEWVDYDQFIKVNGNIGEFPVTTPLKDNTYKLNFTKVKRTIHIENNKIAHNIPLMVTQTTHFTLKFDLEGYLKAKKIYNYLQKNIYHSSLVNLYLKLVDLQNLVDSYWMDMPLDMSQIDFIDEILSGSLSISNCVELFEKIIISIDESLYNTNLAYQKPSKDFIKPYIRNFFEDEKKNYKNQIKGF